VKYLPSPRLIGSFAIILGLFLGGRFVFSNKAENENIYVNEEAAVSTNLDSDKDGLADWEEILWGTNPRISDTDQDGTKDGDEVAQKRDPLVRGPDDAYSPSPYEPQEETENLTERFVKNLAENIGPAIKNGGEYKIDLTNLKRLSKTPELALGDWVRFGLRDVQTSEDTGPEDVKKYFNKVYGVYENTFVTLKEDDTAIMAKALLSRNMSNLKDMDTVINAFDKSIYEIKNIPVPKGYEDFAVNELNYLTETKKIIEGMQNSDKDPLTGIIMLKLRKAVMAEVREFHKSTGQSVLKSGIVFKLSDPGYKLFN